MQKFTIFSIILSASVVFIISDLIASNFKDTREPEEIIESAIEEIDSIDTVTSEIEELPILEENDLDDSHEHDDDEEHVHEEEPTEEIELSSESIEISVLGSHFSEEIINQVGFSFPIIKDSIYSGFIFQFLPFTDASVFTYQWNLFDGESFVGSVYEMKFDDETSSLQGYMKLRDAAQAKSNIGEVNEVNNFKDASFYFNHESKSNTVHLIVRSGTTIYAFDYAHRYHEMMKQIPALLP